jgi:hypothetical protein
MYEIWKNGIETAAYALICALSRFQKHSSERGLVGYSLFLATYHGLKVISYGMGTVCLHLPALRFLLCILTSDCALSTIHVWSLPLTQPCSSIPTRLDSLSNSSSAWRFTRCLERYFLLVKTCNCWSTWFLLFTKFRLTNSTCFFSVQVIFVTLLEDSRYWQRISSVLFCRRHQMLIQLPICVLTFRNVFTCFVLLHQ